MAVVVRVFRSEHSTENPPFEVGFCLWVKLFNTRLNPRCIHDRLGRPMGASLIGNHEEEKSKTKVHCEVGKGNCGTWFW